MLERQLWSLKVKSQKGSLWFLPSSSVFKKHETQKTVLFLWIILKIEPTETDPVVFVHGVFLPGRWIRDTEAKRRGAGREVRVVLVR